MLWVEKWAISNYPDPESLYPLEYPHIVLGWVPEPLIENRSSTLWKVMEVHAINILCNSFEFSILKVSDMHRTMKFYRFIISV